MRKARLRFMTELRCGLVSVCNLGYSDVLGRSSPRCFGRIDMAHLTMPFSVPLHRPTAECAGHSPPSPPEYRGAPGGVPCHWAVSTLRVSLSSFTELQLLMGLCCALVQCRSLLRARARRRRCSLKGASPRGSQRRGCWWLPSGLVRLSSYLTAAGRARSIQYPAPGRAGAT
jgi:hypothetical protein